MPNEKATANPGFLLDNCSYDLIAIDSGCYGFELLDSIPQFGLNGYDAVV
jgi:hypothetical protein